MLKFELTCDIRIILYRTIIERDGQRNLCDLLSGHATESHISFADLLPGLAIKHLTGKCFDVYRNDAGTSFNAKSNSSVEGKIDGETTEVCV